MSDKRIILEYGSPLNNWILVGIYKTKNEVNRAIDHYLESKHIVREPYERRWQQDEAEFVDYGSWSNFFRIREE